MSSKLWPVVVRAAKIAVALRAAYGLVLFGGVLAYRLEIGDYFRIDPHLGLALMQSSAGFYLVWGLFVALYALAAVLLFIRPALALPVYALAFLMDFLLTTRWFLDPTSERAYGGHSSYVEHALNAFDLSVIALLILSLPALRSPKFVSARSS